VIFVFVLVTLTLIAVLPDCAAGLVGRYEPEEKVFEEMEIGELIVYFHQRKIDDAVVEKDYIVYQFAKSTLELRARKSHWRDDLPDRLPAVMISREDAELLAEGDVLFSELYIISPESDVFPIEPVPVNPCWIVRSTRDGRMLVTVIDAVEGVTVGYGVPPPYTAFSFTGPWECPYYGAWDAWYENAEDWFNTMGYVTDGIRWAERSEIRSHVKSDSTAMFYELNHGGSTSFSHGCDGSSFISVGAWQVSAWIINYAKMPFTFLGSCEGMCDTTSGTFSYAFRKGSAESTTTVGYCGMSETYCSTCWSFSIDWQEAMFYRMNQGWTVKAAFDQANADYPTCYNNGCMRFAGDPGFAVKPVVGRDPWAPQVAVESPNGGEVLEYGDMYNIEWTASDNARVVSVTILLSTDGGLTFPDTITTGELNDSSYTWIVPDVDSKTARVKVIGIDGAMNEGSDLSDSDFILWGATSGVGVAGRSGVPAETTLEITDGNPVSANSRIVFGLPASSHVSLDVYDVTGRLVSNLVQGPMSEGYHAIRWNGRVSRGISLSPGVYFLRLDCGEKSRTAKAVIAR
jgi:hypothetical protein